MCNLNDYWWFYVSGKCMGGLVGLPRDKNFHARTLETSTNSITREAPDRATKIHIRIHPWSWDPMRFDLCFAIMPRGVPFWPWPDLDGDGQCRILRRGGSISWMKAVLCVQATLQDDSLYRGKKDSVEYCENGTRNCKRVNLSSSASKNASNLLKVTDSVQWKTQKLPDGGEKVVCTRPCFDDFWTITTTMKIETDCIHYTGDVTMLSFSAMKPSEQTSVSAWGKECGKIWWWLKPPSNASRKEVDRSLAPPRARKMDRSKLRSGKDVE